MARKTSGNQIMSFSLGQPAWSPFMLMNSVRMTRWKDGKAKTKERWKWKPWTTFLAIKGGGKNIHGVFFWRGEEQSLSFPENCMGEKGKNSMVQIMRKECENLRVLRFVCPKNL